MALTLTDLPADVLALICSKLDAHDGDLGYANKEQPLSALAESTKWHPRLCLFSTCKRFRHTPAVRALYTRLSINSGLEGYHPGAGKRLYGQLPDPESSKASKTVESVLKFPGLELKSLRTTVLGLKFISDNPEARQKLEQELESLEIYPEYTNMASAGPEVHAVLPPIIKGLRRLKHLDLGLNVVQGSPILQAIAAEPPLQLKVLKVSIRSNSSQSETEPMRAVAALKTLEEVTVTFTQSKDYEASLLPLRGLPNLRFLSLNTLWLNKAGHCACVRKLNKVLNKCRQLTELHMNDVEVDSAEDLSSPVLRKLVLKGCLCSSSWLERLKSCPSLKCVELTSISTFPCGDEELLPDPGMPAIERALLARPGPVQRACVGLAHLPASCVSWCASTQFHEGLAIFGSSAVTGNLGAQAACLTPLRGSAAANALHCITFEGVCVVSGAIASLASIFPSITKVRLVCDYFPTVLNEGSVAAIVQGWRSMEVLEIVEGEIGWEGQVQKIVNQAKAAVQATQHSTLTVKHVDFRKEQDYILAPGDTNSNPARGAGGGRKSRK